MRADVAADGWEIERRYLVRVPDVLWTAFGSGLDLRQGYVGAGGSSIRIRVGEQRGPVLTIKRGQGIKRREVDAVVPEDVAEALFELAGPRVIEKTRFRVGPWELDRYFGFLKGLALLEIELERVDQPLPDPPADVAVIREVTDDNHFTNNYLSSLSKRDARAFVRAAYTEEAP